MLYRFFLDNRMKIMIFRTEEGQVCGVHQDRLNEVLNHFYR